MTQNSVVLPALSQWKITVCALTTAANNCFIQFTTVTAATSLTITPPVLVVRGNDVALAYSDFEVQVGIGGIYFNVTTGAMRECLAATGINCTSWQNIGGGGGVLLQTNSVTNTVQNILNILQGTGIGIVSDAFGNLTFTNTSPGKPTFGSTGTFQSSDGTGGHQLSNCREIGTTLNCLDDFHPKGPNLGVDITVSPFNARVVNPNVVPSTTGTITGGTNVLVVASNTNWQVNDGLVGVGMGATNCATPPSAPTVVPSLASSSTGTGWMVAGGTGSTSVSYSLIAFSTGGCYTAASPVTTVANSNDAMGAKQLAITSQAIGVGSNVITVTVGSTTGLVSGFWGRIDSTTDNTEFAGYHHFTVVDGTHLSYLSNINSLYFMSSTTASGGTLYYWAGNHIVLPTLPAGTNMWQYGIYRCIGASCALPANAANYSLINMSYPANLGYTDPTYNTWDDFGTTMTPTLSLATNNAEWFVPTTPPATNVNDMLVTTVTNIVGTAFTLANNAVNSTTSSLVRFGNDAAILAAQAAVPKTVTGGGGSIHFPPPVENPATDNYCYVTSSYLTLSGTFNYGGTLCPSVTMNWNVVNWLGTGEDGARMLRPGFAFQAELPIFCRGANPCIIRNTGTWQNFNLQMGVNAIGVFDISGNPTVTKDVNFATDSGSTDYMGILYYYYNSAAGTGQFGGDFTRTSWSVGPVQTIGSTNTPAFVSKAGQEFHFNYMSGNRRGFYFECNNANTACAFYDTMKMGEEWQGPITPLITINNAISGNTQGFLYFEHLIQDSGAEPLLVNASTIGSIGAPIFINGINQPGSGMPIISGDPWNGGISIITSLPNVAHQIGLNHDLTQCNGQENINSNTLYSGCAIPALNMTMVSVSGNHTLTGSEGIVNVTATATITAPHVLAGQSWIVYSQSGSTTLTIDSGTLFANGTTGSVTIPNSQGVVVSCDGTNCHALGLGGGGSVGTGTQNCIVDWATTSSLGSVCTNVTGQIPVANNGAAPTYLSPSMVDSPNSPVVTSPYTIACDSATAIIDRTRTIRFQTGASAITVPLSSASGCAGLVTTVFDDGAGTLTFTRTVGDTLTVVNGTSALDAQTSFTLSNGQYATLSQNATNLWLVRVAIGASAGVSSFSGDGALLSNSSSTGAVVATLAAAAANKVWANCTTSSGTPTYCSMTLAMLPTGIPNANLANPFTTVNSQTCTLGSTCSIGYSNIGAGAIANGTTATTQVAASNDTKLATDAYVDGHFIANGTATLGTSAIASGACATVVTSFGTGIATTDVITVSFNGDPTAVTGYGASATGAVLTIYPYPTTNNANFKVCNSTASSITPSALTLNWKVVR